MSVYFLKANLGGADDVATLTPLLKDAVVAGNTRFHVDLGDAGAFVAAFNPLTSQVYYHGTNPDLSEQILNEAFPAQKSTPVTPFVRRNGVGMFGYRPDLTGGGAVQRDAPSLSGQAVEAFFNAVDIRVKESEALLNPQTTSFLSSAMQNSVSQQRGGVLNRHLFTEGQSNDHGPDSGNNHTPGGYFPR